MTRTIGPFDFHIHSPSCWEILHPGADRVFIRYNGARWVIQYVYANGHAVYRAFRTRDAAIACMVERCGYAACWC